MRAEPASVVPPALLRRPPASLHRARERPREDGRRQRLEIGLTGQLGIDRPKSPGGFEQQHGSFAASRREERDLAAQQTRLCLLEIAQNP